MRIWNYIFITLLLILSLIGICITQLPDNNLHIIACDVGQGDAILITYKNTQILTDGGPDKKVMDCLGRHIPFWDRHIELVISTHPDADHSTGLIEVFKRYNVAEVLINPIDSGTQTIKALEKVVGSSGATVLTPTYGTKLRLGLIYLDIVNPSLSQIADLNEKAENSPLGFYKPIDPTNDYSISFVLAFGKFKGLFTGDIGPAVSDRLVDDLGNIGIETIDYIKIPHHGSKNGLTQNLLEKVVPGGLPRQNPQQEPSTNSSEKATAKVVGVISVGKNNRYGHPSPEIIEMLSRYNIKTYRTDEMGDVETVTDGEKFWLKK